MLHNTFTRKTVEEWTEKAEETLKGKAIQTLARHTYENINLKPLYTRLDQENHFTISEYPGLGDFRRGNSPLGYLTQEWKIAQKIEGNSAPELHENVKSALERGQTAISFAVTEEVITQLNDIVGDLYLQYPFSLDAKDYFEQVISELVQWNHLDKISGYIASDPLAKLVTDGNLQDTINGIYHKWARTIEKANLHMPNLKTILVDTTPYHNGGANAVQEIAYALSTAVFHIENLKNEGQEIQAIFRNLVFKFAIGANFFVEIAKLRAARLLWSKIAESYGVDEEYRHMTISAETSLFTKTQYDPYVNLLRGGNEAFAAVLGGVEYLHVTPYNEVFEEVNSFSDRIARNTQLILKEEAHLTKVIDPAGGSWYVEYLTDGITNKSWELFLEIEDQNGIYDRLLAGWIQKQVKTVRNKREVDASTRIQSIIGTNIYANLSEKIEVQKGQVVATIEQKAQIEPIKPTRLAKSFEQLRQKAEKLGGIRVGLICLGALKNHKARADFISGFLSPGGIAVQKSDAIDSLEQVLDFMNKTKANHYFVCGSNKQYTLTALEMVSSIHKEDPDVSLYLAGVPDEDQNEWEKAGIKQFIHLKSNCYEFLSSLLQDTEVKGHE
ncbi:methylmalonyl-CoA mutase family protein [Cytobacillus sp. Hz8]|uniref:methylmalonyl-CoA mutase family protein n=1 Tax=Cytobacillus sp. Hz8 TaxID=3347168 RepID=UPI0035DE0359